MVVQVGNHCRQHYFHYSCCHPYYVHLFAEFQEKYLISIGNFWGFPNWKFFEFFKLNIFEIFKFSFFRNFHIENFWNFSNWKINKFLEFSKLRIFGIFQIGNFRSFPNWKLNFQNWQFLKNFDITKNRQLRKFKKFLNWKFLEFSKLNISGIF